MNAITNLVLFPLLRSMVSATDVITYIGVPLAVLGVSPIFYTFTLALYTRLKIQRILRQNAIVPRLRARLMTGVVEVDLPVLHLFLLHRQEQRYWMRSASEKTIDGASWSYMNLKPRRWISSLVACRDQTRLRSRKPRSPSVTCSTFSKTWVVIQTWMATTDFEIAVRVSLESH